MASLRSALEAFAMWSLKSETRIGYCQSLNYVAAFLLLVNGGSSEEAFYDLRGLCDSRQKSEGFEGGLGGFYIDGFPLYFEFVS